MAYYSKEIYEKKAMWAENRMERNKEIETLTEEQHEALSYIASKRHNLHTMRAGSSKYEAYTKFFGSEFCDGELYNIITENQLPDMINTITIDFNTFMDDDWNEEGLDCSTDEYQYAYDDAVSASENNVDSLDQDVRDYLAYIDSIHSTDYAPMGGDSNKYTTKK